MLKICIFGNKTSTESLIKNFQANDVAIDTVVILGNVALKQVHIAGQSQNLETIARESRIGLYKSRTYSLTDNLDIKFFEKRRFDIGISVGWQRLIPPHILTTFKHGVFGWHGSGFPFPDGRGRSPLNWSIRLGLKSIVHNCFRYSSGADTGAIFDTHKFPISDNDYIDDVQEKALGHIMVSSMSLVQSAEEGSLKLVEQVNHPFLSFPKLNEKSGEVFPDIMGVETARNIIRSCSKPFPGAFVRWLKDDVLLKVRIWRAKIIREMPMEFFGNELIMLHKSTLIVSFRDGTLISEPSEFEILSSE